MATSLTSIREAPAASGPDYPPYLDGPYEVDSRIFTPEAMDELDEYMAGSAVEQLAA